MTSEAKDGLFYKQNKLFLNKVDLLSLTKKHKTPFYVYDLDEITRRIKEHKLAFNGLVDIHYAMKANSNLNVLKTVRLAGAGADVVSGGELATATEAGFKPNEIIFSGVGKSIEEINLALKKRIKLINVEGPQELDRIYSLAKKNKVNVPIGIRFNPDVSPETHPYITTGFRENKFGMDESFLPILYEKLRKYKKHISLQSISLHIGSQLKEFSALKEAILRTKPVFFSFLEEGHEMKYFDVGGGVGIDYFDNSTQPKTLLEYGKTVKDALSDMPARILCEPGRVLVGPAGVLVAQVEYIKTTHHKTFVILNTGMNHLIRPSLYESYHRILPLKKYPSRDLIVTDIVGPICESGDFLARDRQLSRMEQGEFVAIGETGAYGYSMASLYNLHALPKELCVSNKKILKPRLSRVRKQFYWTR